MVFGWCLWKGKSHTFMRVSNPKIIEFSLSFYTMVRSLTEVKIRVDKTMVNIFMMAKTINKIHADTLYFL